MQASEKIRPIRDHVLIRWVPEDEKTKGGIFIPKTATGSRTKRATVLAVGPGRILEGCGKRAEPEVKPGDVVLVSEYNAAQSNGLNYIDEGVSLTPESDIVAVIEP